ncbi:MAG: aminodeoxychorismate lyase [Pseudomonadota bacterium]
MLINGVPTHQIAATDRGLQYGDGLFETIAVVNGSPRLWERHMARLRLGEQRLGLPPEDKERLLREILSLLEDGQRGVIKIVLTRGQGGRGYRPPEQPRTSRIISLHDWPDYPAEWFSKGISLRICATRLGRNERLAGIKHLNRLEQVLARSEWQDDKIPEGLMLDERDCVIEATQSNLFLLRYGRLLTPDLSKCGVAGVVRELVLELAKDLGMQTVVSEITLDQVKSADALFLTSSLLGICPVAELEECRFNIQKIPSALSARIRGLVMG